MLQHRSSTAPIRSMKPRTWDASSVAGFMLRIGPSSSVFDITTYLLMFYVICPAVCGGLLYHQLGSEELREYYEAVFQAGWFIESMWSQSLVIHLIRTPKLPFLQSGLPFRCSCWAPGSLWRPRCRLPGSGNGSGWLRSPASTSVIWR